MSQIHTEKTLESAIEESLLAAGWQKGDPSDFDPDRGLFLPHVVKFVKATQPKLWEWLEAQNGPKLPARLADKLGSDLDKRGTLHILRHGFKFYGKRVEMAFFRPAHGINEEVVQLYGQNRLTVTRQVRFIRGQQDSVDMVLSLNGLPIATAELKEHLTGQTVEDAIAQYRRRDPHAKLFEYKRRSLVHFAIDPDLVYMTTRLQGDDTYFLPFNKGHDDGGGNPANPGGFKTAYLWEDVWSYDSFLQIVGRFMHALEEEKWRDGKKEKKETLLFPRYHQLDVVRKLVAATLHDGVGKSRLVQHSAGSGKTASISWLAHFLAVLHDANDKKMFDSVVVITDRRVLDSQLQDAIYQIDHQQGVVSPIDKDAKQLSEALEKGRPIIITTLQKFPFVTEHIQGLPDRNYAVIVDEAHSSQTGESARVLRETLAPSDLGEAEKLDADEGQEDYEDEIARVMASRGQQANLSFFAFTATPKGKTLQIFGETGPDDKPVPFHLYSMRQAIQEGFILDVLKNYTTYKTYYRLVKAGESDPELPKRKAAAALARSMDLHPYNLSQKTQVIVEHFRQKVMSQIDGQAKAMVLAASRLHAVRYKKAFEKYLADAGLENDIRTLIAFSGTVVDPDTTEKFTEVGMNDGISQKQLPRKFASDEYQILIVANKYQTGFDQPLLHTMYVDKRLSGVRAVQSLSRLNRTHPGKEEVFVLDFVNSAEEIEEAFRPFYRRTTLSEKAEPQRLYDLQHELEQARVFQQEEVENFAKVFFKPAEKQRPSDQAALHAYLDPAVDRYRDLTADEQAKFADNLRAYVSLYSFLTQIMPYTDSDLEKLYAYGRFLETKLPRPSTSQVPDLTSDVKLKYYRLHRTKNEATIKLEEGSEDDGDVKGPSDVGTGRGTDEQAPLSQIIGVLNERFGTSFTEADELFFDQVSLEAQKDDEVVERAHANDIDNFMIFMGKRLRELMVDRMSDNEAIVSKYLNESDFQRVAHRELTRKIFNDVRKPATST